MRTLLFCTGVCLTAGTFVAAERLTSSSAQTVAFEQQAATQAVLDEFKKESEAKYAAEISALEDERTKAHAEVAMLTKTVEDLTATRNDLATQITTAQSTTNSIREALAELEAQNLELVEKVAVKNASLNEKDAELDALTAQVDALVENEGNALENGPEHAELVAEIESLGQLLATRDDTISALQDRIDTAEAAATETPEPQGDDASAALAEELRLAQEAIDQLTEAAAASEAEIAEVNQTLRDRDATVAELQAKLDASVASTDATAPTTEANAPQSEEVQALSERLSQLTELVDTQTETISNLRMGFAEEPAPAEMASACIARANKIFEISQIKFATGTSAISDQSTTTLDHLRDLAIGCESDEMFIEIGGHTDSLGAETANQRLSEARANSVRDFLIGRGIPAETMVAVGFGEAQPIASNDTALGRSQNRRITFTWQMREDTIDNVDG